MKQPIRMNFLQRSPSAIVKIVFALMLVSGVFVYAYVFIDRDRYAVFTSTDEIQHAQAQTFGVIAHHL